MDWDRVAVAYHMGCDSPFIRYADRSIRTTVLVWVRHLRHCAGIMVLSRSTCGFYLVWQGTEKLKQRPKSGVIGIRSKHGIRHGNVSRVRGVMRPGR